jgi:hypothetical protein
MVSPESGCDLVKINTFFTVVWFGENASNTCMPLDAKKQNRGEVPEKSLV